MGINRAAFGKGGIVFTCGGKEIVAVVPFEDLRFLEELENGIDPDKARAALS